MPSEGTACTKLGGKKRRKEATGTLKGARVKASTFEALNKCPHAHTPLTGHTASGCEERGEWRETSLKDQDEPDQKGLSHHTKCSSVL